MKVWKHAVIGLAAAAFFSLFYLANFFTSAEERIYDMFLWFRSPRERIDTVVFLDVDDNAIAYNGVFPWPRSVTAEGLLRLKEYGARAAIFDIEFIDQGHEGVDSVYLNRGLRSDFERSFAEINAAAQGMLFSIKSGRMGNADVDYYAEALAGLIAGEQDGLYDRARTVARDNDQYLVQASALFGRSWVTLNLRDLPLSGEQALRRPLAEEHFSWPVRVKGDSLSQEYVDVLPPLPAFAQTARGAGFTNVSIDRDGVRRRIRLAQPLDERWYLQLAFAPLVDYLGRPEITLNRRRLLLKDARLPGEEPEDISIPLDGNGYMLLDWPRENYLESFRHVSFAGFSLLEDIEAELEQYGASLLSADIPFFAQFEPSLLRLPLLVNDLAERPDEIRAAKNRALEAASKTTVPAALIEFADAQWQKAGDAFDAWVESREQSRAVMREIIGLAGAEKLEQLLPSLLERYPASAGVIQDEAGYIIKLLNYLAEGLSRYEETSGAIRAAVQDRFCILGRVDTGTTDYGTNPFWPKYVNVGTHAVVLDTILSRSFIFPLSVFWRVVFALLFIPFFCIATSGLDPIKRSAAGFSVIALLFAAALFLFRLTGIFFGPLGTLLAMAGAVMAREIISYSNSEREKSFIRKAFSTYVAGDVVKELIADPSRLQLGGTKRHMSAIFTDVQGFSTISEKLDPEALVSLLNRYLTAMSDVVLNEKGTIDKYEGDAIVAFFGAPLDLSDHALRACVSALAMKKIESELNGLIMREHLSPAPLLTRIGINTGNMVAGNMGTANKMNYTIMGNTVNLAARLEGVNKQYGTWILASEDTVRETGGLLLARKLDRVRVVGINEPVRIYELLDTMEKAVDARKQLVEIFHAALVSFEARNWEHARGGFREALSLDSHDRPSQKYLERCDAFIKQPPSGDWDGVYNLTEK
jgi:adenylate cyclase